MKIARRGQGATFPGAALVRPKEHHAATPIGAAEKMASSASRVRVSSFNSPRSKRETVDCVTPSRSARSACDRLLRSRSDLISMNTHICAYALWCQR